MKFESDFGRQLKGIGDKIKSSVEGSVELNKIFTESFMEKNTKFSSIEEFFEKSPFKVDSEDDLNNIDRSELNAFVNENTDFVSWQDFSETAGHDYAIKKLKENGFEVS